MTVNEIKEAVNDIRKTGAITKQLVGDTDRFMRLGHGHKNATIWGLVEYHKERKV